MRGAEPEKIQSHDRGPSGGDNGDRSGDNGNDNTDQGDGEQMCTTAALTPGTVVHEAELDVFSAGVIWQKVELGTQ